jgi:GntR family transcriptional regulator/MocR family aminotransferase
MRQRDLGLRLDPGGGGTLVQRIVQAVEAAILEGRLPPGRALPGSRGLAASLGVTRNTVIAALQQLEAEGWLVAEPNRGTFVADRPPLPGGHHRAPGPKASASPGFDLPSRLSPLSAGLLGAINLADGLPDPRLAPTEALAKAYPRALRRHGEELLQYGEPMGNRLLRDSLAAWLTERHGIPVPAGRILVTRGSRSALSLLGAALLRPGDRVAVEEPGNRGAWDVLGQGGRVELCPLPVDGEGLCPGPLQNLLESTSLRALYLTPRRQHPTTAAMGPARAQAILELAAAHRVAILEDDYDGAFQYREPRTLPLLAQDGTGQVIHLASLSRLLAPGLRLGFIVAPEGLAERLGRVRQTLEWQGDRVQEWALADLIRDGELSRHLRRVARVYAARRDHLAGLLRREFPETLAFDLPEGGLALWLRVRGNLDPEAWVLAAKARGLLLHPPRHFFSGPPGPFLRMGFAQADEAELAEAVGRMKDALPAP